MPFMNGRGPRHDLLAGSDELAYFSLYIDHEFYQVMVSETNKYALYYQHLHGIDPDWKETNVEELQMFIAINIYMGIVKLPTVQMYFCRSFVTCQPVRDVMKFDRFQKLNKYFHLNDAEQKKLSNDPLYTVRPALDVTNKFVKFYQPGRDLSVDEAMIGFKGRIFFKQYMPQKPTKWGIKVWVIADSQTDYLLKCDVYVGKKKEVNREYLLGEQVVLNMTESFAGHYHHVYFDNFFTSVRLMKNLLGKNIYACGTVRANRQDWPSAFKISKNLKLKQGESRILQHKNIVATVWHDKRDVLLLSTNANPLEQLEIDRVEKKIKKKIQCSRSIRQYNSGMGGVDLNDQYRSYYSTGRSTRKWWKYVFNYVIDVSIINAYILYSQTNSPKKRDYNQLQFRMNLVGQLMCNKERKSKSTFKFVEHKIERGTLKSCTMCLMEGKTTSTGNRVRTTW